MSLDSYSETGGNPKNYIQDVSTTLKNNSTETQCENRASLLKILSYLHYLARQGLLFRGHGDNKGSNFKQLLNFRGEDELVFAEWLKKKNQTYTSPEIQNEMLKDMSPSILRDVALEAIKSSDYHSIMVDESSDVSNKEQALFYVRWVDEDLISHEDFISIYEMKKADSTIMIAVIIL